jgi:O-Antigen ligase
MLLPGGLVVYFGFSAGGFFPEAQDVASVVLGLVLAATIALDGLGGRGGRRVSRGLLATAACFAAYGAWVLVSIVWSHAPLRATDEFGLMLPYLLALVLYGRCVAGPGRMRWLVRGLGLGAFVVCVAGLVSRTLPSVLPVASSLDTPRLSYPVTYWNALGLLAGLGGIICLGLSGDDREPWPSKALSALAVPVFGATLLLTFSRGAIAAGLVGVVVYLVLGRQRSLPGALVSVVPTTAVAVVVAYRAVALENPIADHAAAVTEGRHLAIVVALCGLAAAGLRVLAVRLDRRLMGVTWRLPIARRTLRGGLGVAVVAACAIGVAAGLPDTAKREYDKFVEGNTLPTYANARDRLTSQGADGRIDLWRVAVHQFDSSPVHGEGAGTFELAWEARRPRDLQVVNAHSEYLETLGELGLVGLVLLAGVLISCLVAIARRIRGPDRAVYATAFAAAVTWAIHAGVDWDWQMPVVSLPFFALAGAGFAARRSPTPRLAATGAPATPPSTPTAPATPAATPTTSAPATNPPATPAPGTNPPATPAPATNPPATPAPATNPPATRARATDGPHGASRAGRRAGILLAVGAIAIAVVAGVGGRSESHVKASMAAFEQDDCARATTEARASLRVVSFRPDAHEILAFCEAAAGESGPAVADIERAVGEDPGNWETHYGLAIVAGATGGDPRAEMARAEALDPKNELPIIGADFFRYDLRRYWVEEAAVDELQVAGQGDRNLGELRPPSN